MARQLLAAVERGEDPTQDLQDNRRAALWAAVMGVWWRDGSYGWSAIGLAIIRGTSSTPIPAQIGTPLNHTARHRRANLRLYICSHMLTSSWGSDRAVLRVVSLGIFVL
jgi:hypothetical protein